LVVEQPLRQRCPSSSKRFSSASITLCQTCLTNFKRFFPRSKNARINLTLGSVQLAKSFISCNPLFLKRI
jgi:hypothetical protein